MSSRTTFPANGAPAAPPSRECAPRPAASVFVLAAAGTTWD
ncbi:hypothetical protein [Sphaerisporangium dianthi]|uniref:Uncharacterized protein n=1 Tax=Sphaerisporangium dianthi TaxID=1436120 RepID=A0ABV9CU86_9ACTN